MHTDEAGPAVTVRQHGTRARYVHGPSQDGQQGQGCRCGDCLAANRAREAHRARMILYGRWQPFVDATRAREHVQALRAAGIGWRRAAELAGVAPATVDKILHGGPGSRPQTRRLRPETEQKILAVRPGLDTMGARALVDAAGAQRRLQALVAAGHSQARLAERLGITPANFTTTMSEPRMTAGTVRAVRALYDQMWDVAPDESTHRARIATSRARNYARARGWAVPAAWDEEELDAPDGKPADGWQRSGRTTIRSADLVEDAEFVRQAGGYELAGNGEVAMRLGVPKDRLEKAYERTRAREVMADREAG